MIPILILFLLKSYLSMRAIIRIAALRCPNLGLKTAFLFSEGVGEKEARDSKYSAPMFKSRKERSPLTPF